ncbi:glycoside hydrolase family 3 N-terminal domain-containing protein [Streptomyces griseiscabiei]|uniref:Glycoside hydrolase family 3 N-terminal domain-containing protein n=2 Tax=Streptomyces griseiscabiei TaxID=2993540 RepID=A0ABU4LFH2_9ACTN|nr:glycoside hydrolase family 3 C-terminal domain-containing protein [Streptomyces griseiscabiei]MDX2914542.1 glycoside hydrolase family 3 N-terminal domain-containing protein [Streptomyces griseiscabiei]
MSNAATPRERAVELLARMSLEEKAQQLSALMPNILFGASGLDPAALQQHLGHGIGHLSNAGSLPQPHELAARTNGIQRFLVEQTRLGIPAISHAEALNGFLAPGYTSFPTAIGLAATWNPDAVQAMTDVIRRQMRSVGARQALSPVMDIARDARWGRVHETYGEDVYLASAMSVAFVRGIQGEDLTDGVLATAKHFLGYSMTEAGQNMATTQLGSRELYDVYATPFEAAIKLAGLGSVMNSYSEIDGVPAGASRELLTDLLRGRMGFDGSVVSDYGTVEWLATRQFVADTVAEAGILALEAGLDVELPTIVGYGQNLADAVSSGRLDESVLDDAVMRVLVDKFKLGLFENPYVKEDPVELGALAASGRDLAQSLTDQSITLLKNDGVLPLSKATRVAVIGPHANSSIVNFAAYTHPASIDMMKGMATGESRMAGVGAMMELTPEMAAARAARYAQLAAVDTDALAKEEYGALGLAEAVGELVGEANVASLTGVGINADEPRDLEAAVAAAADADVVILAIGGRAGWFGTRITEGEGTDSAAIELSASQVELVKAVSATGTPLVAVMYQGRPYALTEIDDLLSALLVAYYPGPAGARSVAGVLFGDVNPSGRLPYTMPRATGQVPIYYSQRNGSGYRRGAGDMFRGYIDLEHTPLYPFGHGLGYTTFEYGELSVASSELPTDGGRIRASVEVSNTGERDGVETVQLYASVNTSGITRPALQLIGFGRAALPAGGRATVTFDVETSLLGYTGLDGRFTLQPGTVELAAGPSSADLVSQTSISLVGPSADLKGRRSYLSEAGVTLHEGQPQPA